MVIRITHTRTHRKTHTGTHTTRIATRFVPPLLKMFAITLIAERHLCCRCFAALHKYGYRRHQGSSGQRVVHCSGPALERHNVYFMAQKKVKNDLYDLII